jgi:hypothetical protein
MNIIGLDALVFGVDDIQAVPIACGLRPRRRATGRRRRLLEALDGTAIVIRRGDDARLPKAIGATPSLRETVYGVASSADLDAIADELGRDREVRRDADGVHCVERPSASPSPSRSVAGVRSRPRPT